MAKLSNVNDFKVQLAAFKKQSERYKEIGYVLCMMK